VEVNNSSPGFELCSRVETELMPKQFLGGRWPLSWKWGVVAWRRRAKTRYRIIFFCTITWSVRYPADDPTPSHAAPPLCAGTWGKSRRDVRHPLLSGRCGSAGALPGDDGNVRKYQEE